METILFKVLGGGAFGDHDVEVVDDEAGLVEGLGLAHVVVEARARLHLDHVDQVVKALVTWPRLTTLQFWYPLLSTPRII